VAGSKFKAPKSGTRVINFTNFTGHFSKQHLDLKSDRLAGARANKQSHGPPNAGDLACPFS